MWEYKRFTPCCIKPSEVIEELNKLGEDNWEVIYYVEKNTALINKVSDASYIIILKRKK